MNERLSPREQIALFSSLMLLLALTALAVGSGLTLQASRLNDMDAVLSVQARIVMAEAHSKGNPDLRDQTVVTQTLRLRSGSSVAALYRNEALVWQGGPIPAPSEPLDLGFFSTPATRSVVTVHDWRVLSRREGNLIVQVAQPLAALSATMNTYWRTSAIGTILIALVAGFVTNIILARIIRPLVHLAARVRNLDSTDAFPATRVKGEIGILARALQQSVTELHETRIREARFLANASHELRTPVTALLADLEQTMSRPRSSSEMLGAIQRSQRTASHLKDLASNLLVLSRAGSGAEPVRVDVNLLELALDATDLLVPLAAEKGLSLEADGDDAHIDGDPVLLSRMLENLVSNAIKYTNAGSVIVRVDRVGGRARLSVTDTGIGIAEDQQGRLFEPFHRADLEHRDGFGLGLAAVKGIVEGHGGEIRVISHAGQGSCFEVTFPERTVSVVPA